MLTKTAVVKNEYGIHCRPSSVIIKEAQAYDGEITINANGSISHLKMILELLSLGIQKGTSVEITVQGDNEEEILDKFVHLFEKEFDFKR